MACPICKMRQVAMLENIVAIDRILFPDSNPKIKLSESDLKQYNKTKHAFLVNLYEIYKNVDYVSTNQYNSIEELNSYSQKLGEEMFFEACKVFNNPNIIKELNKDTEQLMESTGVPFEVASPRVILKGFLEVSLDMLTIGEALIESKVNLNESTGGELLLQAHRSFRNDLIEIAMK